MRVKKINKTYIKISFLLVIIFSLQFTLQAQCCSHNIKNLLQDTALVSWAENYILETEYMLKDTNGYRDSHYSKNYYKDLKGLYYIDLIEKVKINSSTSIVLYKMRAGADVNYPFIIKRTITLCEHSTFTVFGSNANLESVYELYLFFDKFKNKFSVTTREKCYNDLLFNYYSDLHVH